MIKNRLDLRKLHVDKTTTMKSDQKYSLHTALQVSDGDDRPKVTWATNPAEGTAIADYLAYDAKNWNCRKDWQVALGTAKPDQDVVPAMPIYRLCKLTRFKFLQGHELCKDKESWKGKLIQLPDDSKISAELISPLLTAKPRKNLLVLLPIHLIRHAWTETTKEENDTNSKQAQAMNEWLRRHVYQELDEFEITKEHIKTYRKKIIKP